MTDIEKAILSCLLNDFSTSKPIIIDSGVTRDWFSGESERELFDMMISNDTVDPISFGSEFSSSAIGSHLGFEYLERVISVDAHWPSLARYIKSFEDEFFRRVMSEVGRDIRSMITDGAETDAIIEETQRKMGLLVAANREPSKADVVDKIISEYEEAAKGVTVGIPTPIKRLNELIGGVHRGQVTLLSGRGGKGKSMWLCMWLNMLGMLNIPATSFAFEDGVDGQMARIASCRGSYSHYKLKTGSASPKTRSLAREHLRAVQGYDVEFVERKLTVSELRNRLYRDKHKRGIQVAFIDGFKDIKRPPNKYNDVGYEEHISQELSDMAKALDIAIVVVMHITKVAPDERISMSHIRGSAQIGNDCRLALALQDWIEWPGAARGKYGGVLDEQDEHGNRNIYGLEVIKTNHGIPCVCPIRKNLDVSRFDEVKPLGEL